jgi:hypothetical protein
VTAHPPTDPFETPSGVNTLTSIQLLEIVERKSDAVACGEAKIFCRKIPDPVRAWNECTDGSFLLWITYYAGVSRRKLAIPIAEIAQLAVDRYWKSEDRTPHEALEILRKWTVGQVSTYERLRVRDQMNLVANKARDIAEADPQAKSAWETAEAVWEVLSLGGTWTATWAAEAAKSEGLGGEREACRRSLHESAEIVRKHITIDEVIAAIKATCPWDSDVI